MVLNSCGRVVMVLSNGQPDCSIRIALPQKGSCPNHQRDSKVHGANMGPICGRQDPGGSHVGPMNLAIWEAKQ